MSLLHGCDAGRKSCAITTARRLGQFLGDERIKDKGLNCNYVVAKRPENLPTSERAIPVAIFSTEPAVARSFLRKWCGELRAGEPPLIVAYCCSSMHMCCEIWTCCRRGQALISVIWMRFHVGIEWCMFGRYRPKF